MPLSPLTPTSPRYYVRRRGGMVAGPFETAAIQAMLVEGKLDGSEEISLDRQAWRPIRTLETPTPPSSAPSLPNEPRGPAADLDGGDAILLAPLELGFGSDEVASGKFPARAPGAHSDARGSDSARDTDLGGFDPSVSLELEDRRPVPRPPGASSSPAPPGKPVAVGFVPAPAQLPGGVHAAEAASPGVGRGGSTAIHGSGASATTGAPDNASATVASLLQADAEHIPLDATQPVRLNDVPAPSAEARLRRRTLTAARGGTAARQAGGRRRPSRRVLMATGGAAALLLSAGVAAVLLDLPDRLRREPSRLTILGDTTAKIDRDSFPAFSEGARRLEAAAGTRSHAPRTRAAGAELLASSVVIHGAERARIPRAEALLDLDAKQAPTADAGTKAARARALAWVALAKGRWREAEEIAGDGQSGLANSDRAVLRGWAALGREDAQSAAAAFQQAAQGDPSPFPSRVAARYALARAREADLSPAAEDAFRAVLTDAPAHFGAALGLARVSKLSAPGRLKLAETIIAKQAGDASSTELAEAFALVSRTARELRLPDRAETASKRARELDPASVAVAVSSGDVLLAEGRIDEAVARYRLAVGAPVSASRTPWLRFARIAVLVESGRVAEAATKLAEVDRRLPGDARVAFWRARAAERALPSDPAQAERSYREALTRDPQFLAASLQLARLLLEQHRSADALAILRLAEKSGGGAASVQAALGQALLASGNASESAKAFRRAIESDPRNPAGHLGLASALEAAGDLEAARAELATLAARGDVPSVGSRLAAILIKLGRREEALATYRKEVAAGAATTSTKVAAARLALDMGQKAEARSLAQAAVDDDPRTPGALLVLADVWRAEGDLVSALADLRRALAVDGSAEAQLEFGRALSALGRDEDALSALSQAAEIPEAAVERGRIFLRRGDVEAAAKELTAATARLRSNAEAFLLLGQAEDRLGHVTSAEAAWKSAVKLAPGVAESRYRLGRLQMDQGQATAALTNLRAAASDRPPAMGAKGAAAAASVEEPAWRPDLYFQLGFAELRQGTRDRALAAFRRYLEIAPASAPARAEVTRQVHELAP